MPSAIQIARTAVPKYQHLTPAIPDTIALGQQAPIVLNEQLVINDRLVPDRYMIKSITGLRAGDLRDSRQARPSDHGEVAYDAFWGGKTVSFEGTMEAGNISQLGRMEADLSAVLGSLVEFPLRFNWWDVREGFYDSQSIAFWTALSGSALLIPGNGRATTVGGGATLSYHNLRGGFVDEVVTACIATSPAGGTNNVGVISACSSDSNYLYGILAYNGTNSMSIYLVAVLNGVTINLTNGTVQLYNGVERVLWLRLTTLSDTATLSVYGVDPSMNQSATPIDTCSYTLQGSAAQKLGYAQPGFCGVIASQTSPWSFLDWRVDALWPSDFVVNARSVQQPAFSHGVMKETNRFKRDFMFALRASNPALVAPANISSVVPISTASVVAFGRIYPRVYPLAYIVPLSEPTGTILTQNPTSGQKTGLVNRGNWVSKPVITITGGISNPILTNLTTGSALILDGVIAQNDYVVIDCVNHTLVNSVGANVFGMFDPSSAWLTLAPGDNVLQLTGSSSVGTPAATVSFAHTWI